MKNEYKILIAEDDADLRDTLETGFIRKGFEVKTAGDGVAAFDIQKEWFADAVITDIRMPNGNGVDLINQLAALNDDAPSIICITGYSDLSQVEAFDKGVDAFFQKPVSSDLLIAATTHFVIKRHQMNKLESLLKANPGQPVSNVADLLALTTQMIEEFTALWGVVGMFSEAASDEKGFVLNNKRLQWCSKKLEEYCSRLSEEMVILKNVIEQKTLPIDS